MRFGGRIRPDALFIAPGLMPFRVSLVATLNMHRH